MNTIIYYYLFKITQPRVFVKHHFKREKLLILVKLVPLQIILTTLLLVLLQVLN
jgi:hypothetical protein